MKYAISILITATLFLLSAGEMVGQNARQMVRKGNKLYEEGKFTEAEVQYMKSLENDEEIFEGKFNMADALIRQEKFDQAIEQLQILAESTENKEQLAKIYHNIGNAQLQKKELEKSIESYKSALRNNPQDDETRYNLAYAQNQLKQQQEQEQEQNKDDKDQDKKEQEEKDKEQEQDQKEQDQKDQEDQQKEEEQQQQQNQDQQKQEEQDQQQPEPNPNEMSKENAEQILEALLQDERDVKEKVDEQKKINVRSKRVDKEW